MRSYTLIALSSLFIALLTWLFSADFAPSAQSPTPPIGFVPVACDEDAVATRHTVVADIDYVQKTVHVEQRIRYYNRTDTPPRHIGAEY